MEPARWRSSSFKLQNPFVLRVGQIMTGFGLGCGLGIGVGIPIPMDIPGVSQVMGAANGMTRHIGGGHQIQGLIKRVGIKNLEAGFGCGLALKPGVPQQILHMLQEGSATMLHKLQPQNHEETPTSGVSSSGAQAYALKPSQSPFAVAPPSPLASTPFMKNSETEVEKLRSHNEILRTLLRHQEKIEDLERENAVLREQLNLDGNIRTKDTFTHQCFDCRRLSRRRN